MYLPIDSGIVRFVLRCYFVIILIYIGLIGDRVCHLTAKLRLLRGRHVDVTHMTGWLSGPSTIKATWQFRRIPGGVMGLAMLFAAILAILSDLGVSAFVRSVPHQSTCDFGIGAVMQSEGSYFPEFFGATYQLVSQAQINSVRNDGLWGIYRKADNNTDFAADEDDVLGAWSCAYGPALAYDAKLSATKIEIDLKKQGHIYKNGISSMISEGPGLVGETDPFYQLTTISTTDQPHGEVQGLPWDFKASVTLNEDKTTKKIQTLHCTLIGKHVDIVNTIISNVNTTHTLSKWATFFQSNMYLGMDKYEARDEPAVYFAWLLNSMTMVSGSQQSISYKSKEKQGCIIAGASLPAQIITLFCTVTALSWILTGHAIFLQIRIFSARRSYDRSNTNGVSSKEIVDGTPNGLLEWMQHAVHESDESAVRPEKSNLRSWWISVSGHGGRKLGVVNKVRGSSIKGTSSSPSLSSPPPPPLQNMPVSSGYPAAAPAWQAPSPNQYPMPYMGANKQYSAVNTQEVHY